MAYTDSLTTTCAIWQVDLGAETAPADASVLDEAERQRAERIRFDRHRQHFVACRAALRSVLGTLLDRDPRRIVFHTGPHGRPSLAGEAGLEFNVSHSGEVALIAVSARAPLGVDIEVIHEVDRVLDLARRYLHPEELTSIETAAPAERSATFLTCWTRKEAALKSTGVGLTVEIRSLNVGADTAERILELPDFPPLRMRSFQLEAGYIGACATAADVRHIEFHRHTRSKNF